MEYEFYLKYTYLKSDVVMEMVIDSNDVFATMAVCKTCEKFQIYIFSLILFLDRQTRHEIIHAIFLVGSFFEFYILFLRKL